jgi:hypothetical protein
VAAGLRVTVRRIRALGAALLVLGPIPQAAGDVPDVYRDDNHLTTSYPTWLAPLLSARLDEVLAAYPPLISH